MKRKFILYPAVALALMTSASLSSCVDTDEPESLENLRNAVAQEIQANSELLKAKAAVENAYVAVVNAEARKGEADAALQEYKNIQEKADAELAALKDQLDGEVAKVDSDHSIEVAKIKTEDAIAQAKKDLETNTEAYLAEIEKQKVKLLEAQLDAQIQIAKLNDKEAEEVEAGRSALATKFAAWTAAQDAVVAAEEKLAKAQKEFASDKSRATDSIAKVQAITKAEEALEKAKDAYAATDANFANNGVDAFAKEWKKYQDLVDGVKAKEDSLTGVQTLLSEQLGKAAEGENPATGLVKVEEEAKKAFDDKTKGDKNAPAGVMGATKKGSDITIACDNEILQGIISDLNLDLSYKLKVKEGDEEKDKTFYFKLSDDKKKYVGDKDSEFPQSSLGDVVKNIKAAFDDIAANALVQNSRIYKAIKEKAENDLKGAQDDLGTSDSKGARKDLAEARKAMEKAKDAADAASADGDFAKEAKNIFGDYADPTKVFKKDKDGNAVLKGDYTLFYNVVIDMDDPNADNSIMNMLAKLGYTDKLADGTAVNGGLYGTWKTAFEGDKTAIANKVKANAQAAAAAAQKYVDDYTTALNTANDKAKNAENADGCKAEKAAYEAAKTARENKAKELKAVTDELAPIAGETAINKVMAEYYAGLVKAMDSKLTTPAEYDTYRLFALSKDQQEIDKAEIALIKAKRDLEDFLAGVDGATTDATAQKLKAIKDAETELESAKVDEAAAKKAYEKELSYYGK